MLPIQIEMDFQLCFSGLPGPTPDKAILEHKRREPERIYLHLISHPVKTKPAEAGFVLMLSIAARKE
jgi:hypothetical protein